MVYVNFYVTSLTFCESVVKSVGRKDYRPIVQILVAGLKMYVADRPQKFTKLI